MRKREASFSDCFKIAEKPPPILTKNPDIIAIGAGYKTEGGNLTNKFALWACVRKKFSIKKLPVSKLIPKEIMVEMKGRLVRIPVDVHELGEIRVGSNDWCNARADVLRPVSGGYACAAENAEIGGSIGTKVWATDLQKPAIFSCAHVFSNSFDPNSSRIIIQPPGWEDKEGQIGFADLISDYTPSLNPADCGRAILWVDGQRLLPSGYFLEHVESIDWVKDRLINSYPNFVQVWMDGAQSCFTGGVATGLIPNGVPAVLTRGDQIIPVHYGPVLETTPVGIHGDCGSILFLADDSTRIGQVGIGYHVGSGYTEDGMLGASFHLDLSVAFKLLFLEPPRPLGPGDGYYPGTCALLDADFLELDDRGTLYHLFRLIGGGGSFGQKLLKFTSDLNTGEVKSFLADKNQQRYQEIVMSLIKFARGSIKIEQDKANSLINLLYDLPRPFDHPNEDVLKQMIELIKASVGLNINQLLEKIKLRSVFHKE